MRQQDNNINNKYKAKYNRFKIPCCKCGRHISHYIYAVDTSKEEIIKFFKHKPFLRKKPFEFMCHWCCERELCGEPHKFSYYYPSEVSK